MDKWDDWQHLVLNVLEKHDESSSKINDRLTILEIEIAMLKVKSGFWGGISGIVSAAIIFITTKGM